MKRRSSRIGSSVTERNRETAFAKKCAELASRTFDNDVEALTAVLRAGSQALIGDGRLEVIAALAQAARRTLAALRIARKKPCNPRHVGGCRRLPRPVWGALRHLTRLHGRAGPIETETISQSLNTLAAYADAIQLADLNWKNWEVYRQCRIALLPLHSRVAPDRSWRFPLARQLYQDLGLLFDRCSSVVDLLTCWQKLRPRDCWYRVPRVDASDEIWYADMRERWRHQIVEVSLRHQFSRLDDLAVELLKTWQCWNAAQRSISLAEGNLGRWTAESTPRLSTEIVAALDNLRCHLPTLPRISNPARSFASFSPVELGKAASRLWSLAAILQTFRVPLSEDAVQVPEPQLFGEAHPPSAPTRREVAADDPSNVTAPSSIPAQTTTAPPGPDLSKFSRSELALWNYLAGRVASAAELAEPSALDTSPVAIRVLVRGIRRRFGGHLIDTKSHGYYRPDAPSDWEAVKPRRKRRVRTA